MDILSGTLLVSAEPVAEAGGRTLGERGRRGGWTPRTPGPRPGCGYVMRAPPPPRRRRPAFHLPQRPMAASLCCVDGYSKGGADVVDIHTTPLGRVHVNRAPPTA